MLTLKVRIDLNINQELVLNTLAEEHRLLYNHLLDGVKKSSLTFKELNQLYKNYRLNNKLTINSKSAQNTCIGLINNIKSFYALRKKDCSARFPYRFKSHKYFTSFMYDWNSGNGGFKLEDSKLIINLIGLKKDDKRLVIDLPKYCEKITSENVKTLTFSKNDLGDYYISFVYGETESNKMLDKNYLSIDLGYSELVTGYSNKIGNFSVQNLKLKKLQRRAEHLQSIKDKKVKGSKKFNKMNGHFKRVKKKQVDKLKDFQHKVSTEVVKVCVENGIGNLIVGDIKVKKVIKNPFKEIKNQMKTARSLNDLKAVEELSLKLEKEYTKIHLNGLSKSTSLGRFKTFLEYKSRRAGMEFHSINEAYTSQQNCLTDEIMFSSQLDNRSVEVENGLFIDRDLNSAINIAKKCKVTWLDHRPSFELDKMYLDSRTGKMVLMSEYEK